MKIRNGVALAAAVATIGVWAAKGKAQGDDALESHFVREVNFSTEYIIIEADGTSQVFGSGDVMHVLGKPDGTLTPSTGSSSGTPHCGSYQSDGVPTYSNSAHFNTTLYGSFADLVDTGDSRPVRFPNTVYVVGARPASGKKMTSIALYQEGTYPDAGVCIEGSTTYHKYTVTMD